ncbi:MAG TPA: SoxR reducing system RseC family protein [Thermotogota bacterium]|nr:SoxR reducing system RseC family protein [Thermotogota bacterium]HRW33758.1 SoxR reducing system RseC family protein [Thermotogota bacterium]
MLEQAVVEKVLEKSENGTVVLLKKERPDACHHCQTRMLCGIRNDFQFKALNLSSEELKKGDLVEYLLPEVSVIKLSFLVYSVPLIVFLLTISLLFWIFPDKEYLSLSIALLTMIITFFLVGLYDKKKFNLGKKNMPKIQKRIKEG